MIQNLRNLEESFIPILQKCKNITELKQIHTQIIKFSLFSSNFLVTKMIDICSNNSSVDYASLLFNQINEPNIFAFNAMIRSYSINHNYMSSITLFRQMLAYPHDKAVIFPNKFTFPFVIRSCGGLLIHGLGKQVHGCVCKCGLEDNLMVENSLLDMYVKCSSLRDATKVFDEMSQRDVVSWNCLITGYVRLGLMKKARDLFNEMPSKSVVSWTAMISGYTQIGCYISALDVFRDMQKERVKADEITVISVLPACAQLGALELGKWIHFYCEKTGLLNRTSICNALIEMYARSGSIHQARQLFDQMQEKDVISWSTMIVALANHSRGDEAIGLFERMKQAKVKPNAITFVGLLSACAHSGFLRKGLQYFDHMKDDYKIKPSIEHYSCMVDMLGRAGRLGQALELLRKMPMKPDAKIWGSLLSSCRTYKNIDVAEIAMERLLEFEPNDTGNYVLLSNIYAEMAMWEGVSKMRKLIRSKSMKKTPGCSLIEVENVVEEFISGDHSKPFFDDLQQVLKLLKVDDQSECQDIVELMSEDWQ